MSPKKMQQPEWAYSERDNPLHRDYLVIAQAYKNLEDVNRLYYPEQTPVAMVAPATAAPQAAPISRERAEAVAQLRQDREQEVVNNARDDVSYAYTNPGDALAPKVMDRPAFDMPADPIDRTAIAFRDEARQAVAEAHGLAYEKLLSEEDYPNVLAKISSELHEEDRQAGMV